MKKMLLAAVAALVFSSFNVKAGTIVGAFDVFVLTQFSNPNVRYDITNDTGFAVTLTGPFAALGGNIIVTPPFPGIFVNVGSIGSGDIFTLTGNGLIITLDIQTAVYLPLKGEIDGEAIASFTGFDPTPVAYALGVNQALGSLQDFSAQAFAGSSVPGPIVGAGLPGLIAAAFGLLWWVRKKK